MASQRLLSMFQGADPGGSGRVQRSLIESLAKTSLPQEVGLDAWLDDFTDHASQTSDYVAFLESVFGPRESSAQASTARAEATKLLRSLNLERAIADALPAKALMAGSGEDPGAFLPGLFSLKDDEVDHVVANAAVAIAELIKQGIRQLREAIAVPEKCGSEGGEPTAPPGLRPRLPLRLSFDVNETIVMLDTADGKTVKECISTALAARALGTTKGDGASASWHWDGAIPGKDVAREGASAGKLTYKAWVGSLATLEREERASAVHAFLDSGQPGEGLSELAEELMMKLRLPATERLPGESSAHDAAPSAASVCILIPAFLRLIRDLTEEGREFSVAFRTFGSDLPKVVKDWNRFCDGAHPLHPGFSLPPSRRLGLSDRENFGYLWRNSGASAGPEDEVALVLGCVELAPGTDVEGWGSTTPSAALEWYRKQDGVRVVCGLQQVRDFFEVAAREGRTVGTRECYPNWASHGFVAETGKLHFADAASSPQYHAIFFDDNIVEPGPSGKGIVATRDIAKPAVALPFGEADEIFMLRVDPIDLVLDDAYMRRRVASAEERLAARLGANR